MHDNTSTGVEAKENRERQNTLTGVDLAHPPRGIENLPDTEKRFLAGMVREGFIQGLDECRRSGTNVDRKSSLKFADQWIARSIPFLSGVIGDVG
jgi:hypothetical protein